METTTATAAVLPATVEIESKLRSNPHLLLAERIKFLRANVEEGRNFARTFAALDFGGESPGWQNRHQGLLRTWGDSRFADMPQKIALLEILEADENIVEVNECIALIDLLADCRERDRMESEALSAAIAEARAAEAAAAQRLAMLATEDPQVVAARARVLELGGTLEGISPTIPAPVDAPAAAPMQAQDFSGPVAILEDLAPEPAPQTVAEKPGKARRSPFAPAE